MRRISVVLLSWLAPATAGCSGRVSTPPSYEAGADATSASGGAGDVTAADGSQEAASDGTSDVGSDDAGDAPLDTPLDMSLDALYGSDAEGGGEACPNAYDLARPDAGGVCCCNFDVLSPPVCDADGASPSCRAGYALHHDQDCSSSSGPCSNPGDAAVDAGAQTCRDDRPAPGTPFLQNNGTHCALPDGGQGVPSGSYGCVDPTACHCKAVAGTAQCRSGDCVYASCSGANEDDHCSLPGGATGICCAGTCRNLDFGQADNNNCGGCGLACPPGKSCVNGLCGDPSCNVGGPPSCCGLTCAAGQVCSGTVCRAPPAGMTTCSACLPTDCVGHPDGTPCSGGLCCNHVCVSPMRDDNNCGGCGIVCCPGAHCSPGSWFPQAVCL